MLNAFSSFTLGKPRYLSLVFGDQLLWWFLTSHWRGQSWRPWNSVPPVDHQRKWSPGLQDSIRVTHQQKDQNKSLVTVGPALCSCLADCDRHKSLRSGSWLLPYMLLNKEPSVLSLHSHSYKIGFKMLGMLAWSCSEVTAGKLLCCVMEFPQHGHFGAPFLFSTFTLLLMLFTVMEEATKRFRDEKREHWDRTWRNLLALETRLRSGEVYVGTK